MVLMVISLLLECSSTPPKSRRQNLGSEKEANIVKTLQTNKGANFKQRLSKLGKRFQRSIASNLLFSV